ncbi:DUF4235 domain-containing protein [Aeromicrobium sp. CTD01-1L150]|uniref:DUF4235 domain-containing protein n=1 Tax=Aeromicrobium sp. CTD01-1L150 TaxID=3341830 RepID=UPI0035BF9D6B
MATRDKRKGKADSAAEGKNSKKGGGKSTWKLLDRASSVAAGLLAREVSQLTWRAATGRKPPSTGRNPEVDAREAIAWAVVGGALVELVKVLVRRWAANYWVRSTGNLPPGMTSIKGAGAAGTMKKPAPLGEPAPSNIKHAERSRSRRRRRRSQ